MEVVDDVDTLNIQDFEQEMVVIVALVTHLGIGLFVSVDHTQRCNIDRADDHIDCVLVALCASVHKVKLCGHEKEDVVDLKDCKLAVASCLQRK